MRSSEFRIKTEEETEIVKIVSCSACKSDCALYTIEVGRNEAI